MAVISNHSNSTDAWKQYKSLHLSEPSRELYIFHTSNEEIEVIEQKFIGGPINENPYGAGLNQKDMYIDSLILNS
ncbi:hypothetical protein [Anaerophilus nitritogenes]|uniref:hypothetical protein n=1 Tax=Anaerophilus nitritogenes TaxID=2498136 RepID=UPI00101D236C|nr:hypothetical protein [Anaerophilus nitritogenes]